MRHMVAGKKLGRTTAHRQAMIANLAAALAVRGRIETTLPRAKVLRSVADRLVTLGKRGTIAARRRALQLVRDRKAVHTAFADLAVRFKDRHGGYTRVLKLGYRHGDSAPMAMIEYLQAEHAAHTESEKHDADKKTEHAKTHAKKTAVKDHSKKAAVKIKADKSFSAKSAPKRRFFSKAKSRSSGE